MSVGRLKSHFNTLHEISHGFVAERNRQVFILVCGWNEMSWFWVWATKCENPKHTIISPHDKLLIEHRYLAYIKRFVLLNNDTIIS